MDTQQKAAYLLCGILVLASQLHAQLEYGGSIWDTKDYRTHPCNRPCETMSPPRLCKYRWTLETYGAMSKACGKCPFVQEDCLKQDCISAGGVHRAVMVINRMLPGPTIEVCEGDTIQVDLVNDLQNSESTSIHWHGLTMRGVPWMDGVSRVTQCAITPGSTFTYKFPADDAGTQLYHGHSGMQRADGLFGSLIIRQTPERDPHYPLYDYDLSEHVIVVTDWFVDLTVSRFVSHHHDDGDNKPGMMLINGLGAHQPYEKDNVTYHTPRAEFHVEGGKRYRFRVISASILNCPIQFSVDGHMLTMIGTDGSSFKPFVADSFNLFAGERFDFILHADKTDSLRNYWIRARGMADCSVKKANQVAMLKYAGAPDVPPPESTDYEAGFRDGILLNPWNKKGTDQLVELTRMVAEQPDGNDTIMTATPDRKYFLGMDFNKVSNFKYNNPVRYDLKSVPRNQQLYQPQINHISSELPASPPLTQFDDVDVHHYCNEFTTQKDCKHEWCHCIHKIDAALGDLVELIIVDEGVTFNANHPMHLHGFKFRTMGIGKVGPDTSVADIKAMDARGELNRTTTGAILKDTVTVPDGGYTIVRFWADNPGLWFFHCHIEYHADLGMGVVIQVGGRHEWPTPPKNFPKCGSFNADDDHHDDDDDDDDHDHDDGHSHHNSNNDNNGSNNGVTGDSKDKTEIVVQCVAPSSNAGVKGVNFEKSFLALMVVLVASCKSVFDLW